MSEEKETKSLISTKNISILTTGITALSGAFYQVYDWAYESGLNAGKLEILGEADDEAEKLEDRIKRLKRQLRECSKKDGSSNVSKTKGSN